MAFAVRAEHGWYLADAMFIYELLASLVEGEEKQRFRRSLAFSYAFRLF